MVKGVKWHCMKNIGADSEIKEKGPNIFQEDNIFPYPKHMNILRLLSNTTRNTDSLQKYNNHSKKGGLRPFSAPLFNIVTAWNWKSVQRQLTIHRIYII